MNNQSRGVYISGTILLQFDGCSSQDVIFLAEYDLDSVLFRPTDRFVTIDTHARQFNIRALSLSDEARSDLFSVADTVIYKKNGSLKFCTVEVLNLSAKVLMNDFPGSSDKYLYILDNGFKHYCCVDSVKMYSVRSTRGSSVEHRLKSLSR